MILIISTEQDDHAKSVAQKLNKYGEKPYILDLSLFPRDLHISLDISNNNNIRSRFINTNEEIDLTDSSVIWWRRPQPFLLHSEITDYTNSNFAYSECYSAISGLWQTINAFWVNNPSYDELASRKPYQLKIAKKVGLEIPKTKITNDPNEARKFIEELGFSNTVYKAFTGTEKAWRETRILKEQELDLLENVQFAPVIFQEYIPLKLDLRITMIGNKIIASAIYPNKTSYISDYRMNLNERVIEPYKLPNNISDKLHSLMDNLGLVYGAIDMRLTDDNRYVFLEINPSGQWLFMEYRTGIQITEIFAQYLLDHI